MLVLAADRIVNYLCSNLGDEHQAKSRALLRFYKTHRYGALSPELQGFAQGILGHPPESAEMRRLTLLAMQGEQPACNSRPVRPGTKQSRCLAKISSPGFP